LAYATFHLSLERSDVNASVDPVKVIRSAGGIPYRLAGEGTREVALIHRPSYDDWTFPKGKVEVGEEPEQAALREVGEETGLRVRLADEAGVTSYVDQRGRQKTARYWTMEVLSGEFAANAEVDELRWLPLDDALHLLTYDRDRSLLSSIYDKWPDR
jgi:8-oxo-dGTP pyrophosphatase MutT (NUDIX family)